MQLKDYVKYVRPRVHVGPAGEVHKPRVGLGAFTTDDAKLCLLTEDFLAGSWGRIAHLAPTPPYVRLCYGEAPRRAGLARIFTGLSEIHLLKNLDLDGGPRHASNVRLRVLLRARRDIGRPAALVGCWRDVHPQAVSAGLPGGKGPMFYSWHYRLPPWAPGFMCSRARTATSRTDSR